MIVGSGALFGFFIIEITEAADESLENVGNANWQLRVD